MAKLNFTKQSDGRTWVSSEVSVSAGSTVNFDVERKGGGALIVCVKQSGGTRYKGVKTLDGSRDFCFNFANNASSAVMLVKLVSYSEVENGSYV